MVAMFRTARSDTAKARDILHRPDLTPLQARVVMGKLETIFRGIADGNPGIAPIQALDQTIRCVAARIPRKIVRTAPEK